MLGFAAGKYRVLVSKPSIAGFGMNFQGCRNMAFVGLSDSFEAYYQATRRCWRFGQKNPVNVHIITSELEGNVVSNIRRKEQDAERMAESMVEHMSNISSSEIKGVFRTVTKYEPTQSIQIPQFMRAA
jgi:SNF2 family DNA or RNA helicase